MGGAKKQAKDATDLHLHSQALLLEKLLHEDKY